MELLRTVWGILDLRERRRLLLLTPAVVAMAFVQTVAMIAVLPFLALLSDPSAQERIGVLRWLYDLGRFNSLETFLFFVGVLVLVVVTVGNGFSALTTWALYRFAWMRNYSLSKRLLECYLRRPYTFFLENNSANLLKTLLTEVQQVVSGIIVNGMQLFARVTVTIFTIGMLIYVEPVLALVAAVTIGGLYGGIYWVSRRSLAKIGSERLEANRGRFQAAAEIFGGIKEVKLLGVESAVMKRFNEPSLVQANSMAQAAVISQLPRFALETIAFGSVLVMVLYLLAAKGSVVSALPVLGLYGFAALRLLPAMQTVFAASTSIRFNLPALENVAAELTAPQPNPRSGVHLLPFCEAISLESAYVRYPASNQPVLKDIDVVIPKGSWVAIVGETGSGKSTLVDVILGLLPLEEGRLLIDGDVLTSQQLSAWQQNLGYVPQSIFVADDTVLRNIAFGCPDAAIDRAAAEAAARVAQIHEFIVGELPSGYETRLGERGVRLSGGERQRIGIARALYRRPSVLVLDEATSALDTVTEGRFFDQLAEERGKRTIISIAHRMSTTRQCDAVYVLANGTVIAAGTYAELAKDSQVFAALIGR